ncbi:MAG: ribonuclease III [Clostridiales bacterium]|nr:ribonuclease III [Clostridiales bacterium]
MNLTAIESKLNYTFNNKDLLTQAFTHSSYANLEQTEDNERMEFLGDAILGCIISEYLFAHNPERDAGELSAMKSRIVSADGLRPMVDKLGLLEHLRVVSGETDLQRSRKIAANLFEAVLAAIYLDGGMSCAQAFVLNFLSDAVNNATKVLKDDKTLLYEYCQSKKLAIEYKLVQRSGPDDKPSFKYALLIDGKQVAEGVGPNIKAAEQQAAHKIVVEWRID